MAPILEQEIEKLRTLARTGLNPAYSGEGERIYDHGADATAYTAPQPVISETLVERAPEQMPAIVRSMHHTAADALDTAALHLEEEMRSCLVLMRDEADRLRSQGDSQASTIELLATLIRDTHTAFKSQADKLAPAVKRYRTDAVKDVERVQTTGGGGGPQ